MLEARRTLQAVTRAMDRAETTEIVPLLLLLMLQAVAATLRNGLVAVAVVLAEVVAVATVMATAPEADLRAHEALVAVAETPGAMEAVAEVSAV